MRTASGTRQLGPGGEAVRLSFWSITVVAALAACAWAGSNIRRIPADNRAVVTRFGAFVRTQDAGLLIAWPRPFESVVLVPGSARVLERHIQSLERDPRARAGDSHMTDAEPPEQAEISSPDDQPGRSSLPDALAGSGYVLTGDNGAVQLDATLYYRVSDPYAYVLQKDRLDAALERIVSASAVEVAANRDLDAILVARPEQQSADQQMAAKREQLRGDLAQVIEQHLQQLESAHAGLGIEVARVDVRGAFPASAVNAFNSVLTSLQVAERNIAEARTDAERRRQDAQQDADRIVQNAQASAAERVATAQTKTTAIRELEAPLRENIDPGLLARVYRDRVQQILSKVARVTTIDPHNTSNLILPGNAR
ncbi:Membrane protease [Paraburkholderia piptadeniae]|uniref:Membrane protease n=1 Tax=Paraburkholderia piptadeniae TaxID=1701573 RepID=A0A1N7SNK7_9BURK|nr:SPFH domain-containing protein [Paraburkholderia piptadeniae]SIT48931.1 Membrane protease [Paraburkholderia piptadeniae]